MNDVNNQSLNNPQNQMKTSGHLLELVRSYVDNEKVRADVVEAYNEKKPKSYAQVFNGLFRFSKLTLFAFHTLSFLIATPLVFSLAYQFILRKDQSEIKTLFDSILMDSSNIFDLSFMIPATITVMILFLLEYGQHTTLNSLFNIFFQWGKKVVPGLALLALLFSAASVSTSGFGAREFIHVSKAVDPVALGGIDSQINQALDLRNQHSDRSNSIVRKRDSEIEYLRQQRAELIGDTKKSMGDYAMIMMCISLFFEIMIIANTFNIHNYQYKSAKETEMVNDLVYSGGRNIPMGEYNIVPPPVDNSMHSKNKVPVQQERVKPKKVNGHHPV